METLKTKKVLALVGIVCLLLGIFLPYYTISIFGYTKSISLWGYLEGKIVLILTLANALFIFKDFIKKYIPQLFKNGLGIIVEKANNPKFSLIPTILVAGFTIYMSVRSDIDSEYVKFSLGFWVLWIGVLALIGHAIFYRNNVGQILQQESAQQPMNYQQESVQQPMNYQQAPVQQPMNYQQAPAQQSMNYQQAPAQQPMNYQQAPVQQPMNYQQTPAQQPMNYQQAPVQQPMNYQQTPAQQSMGDMNKKYCPQCKNQVDVNATTCFMCGHNF